MLGQVQIDAFWRDGLVRVDGAFDPQDAAAMRELVWGEMERRLGIDRADPGTWKVEHPSHLNDLRGRPEMERVGTDGLRGTITALLGTDSWRAGKGWGAVFVVFPADRLFDIPTTGWHCDAPYDLPLEPLDRVQVISLFGDVEARAGGMQVLAGAHRVLARWAAAQEPGSLAVPAKARKGFLRSHEWFASLAAPGPAEARVASLMEVGGEVEGLPIRVAELSGRAGDVYLVHPLTPHVRPTNAGQDPRFMLSTFASITHERR